MKKHEILLITLLVTLVSCSSGDKLGKEENQIAVFDDGLYLSEAGEDGVVELVIPEVQEYTEVKEEAEEKANMNALELGTPAEEVEEVASVERSIASIGEEEPEDVVAESTTDEDEVYADVGSDAYEYYEVQENDSLMLISFKLYNNFDKWKELAMWNEVTEETGFKISIGDKLKFKVKDENGNQWVPSGSPYLVKTGDYLGLISKKVYEGNARFWYDIWKNNEMLVKDPNKVYVGFTLYTQPFEVVQENERLRMEEYRRRYGKSIRKRDLAGALDESVNKL